MERDSAAPYPSYEKERPPSYVRAMERAEAGVAVRSDLIDGRVVRANAVEVAGPSPSKSRPTLSEVRDFAEALISSAGAVVDHLDELAGALSGVVPEPWSEVKQETPPSGIVDATFRRLLTLDALIGRMGKTASHIRNTIA